MGQKIVPTYEEIAAMQKSGALTPQQVKDLTNRRKALDDFNANVQYGLDLARLGGGAALTTIGSLPLFSSPGLGAIGGGLVGLGEGMIQGQKASDLAKSAASGAALGYATGNLGNIVKISSPATKTVTSKVASKTSTTPSKVNPIDIKPNVEKSLNDNLAKYETISLKDYATKYNPEMLQSNVAKSGLPQSYVSQVSGIPENSLRNYTSANVMRNANDIYALNGAVGSYTPANDAIKIASNYINPNDTIGTLAHEGSHLNLRILQDAAKQGNKAAANELDNLYSIANSNTPVASNEVVARAFQSVSDPGYRVNPRTIEALGSDMNTFNAIKEYLKPYNNNYLFNDLLRKVK